MRLEPGPGGGQIFQRYTMEPQAQSQSGTASDGSDQHTLLIDTLLRTHRTLPGALLPILHAIQEALGFVPPSAVPQIASALNLSQAEVHGVLSFYHDFRTQPPGRHILKLCRAESCQAMGSDHLETHLRTKHGLDYHDTTADGAVTLEPIYCLGNCACSPSAMHEDTVHGRITTDWLDAWIQNARNDSKGTRP